MKKLLKSVVTASFGLIILLAGVNAFTNSPAAAHLIRSRVATGRDALGQRIFLEEEKVPTATKLNLDSEGVILKGFDIVAYFKEGKPIKGSSVIASPYGGATYLFASATNKAEFDENPEKYAPKYGGFCAYGVALGVLADPEGPSAPSLRLV
jgi:YHS domain-containing protein